MPKVYFINGLPTEKNLGLYHYCVKSYDQNKVCLECPIRGLPRVNKYSKNYLSLDNLFISNVNQNIKFENSDHRTPGLEGR